MSCGGTVVPDLSLTSTRVLLTLRALGGEIREGQHPLRVCPARRSRHRQSVWVSPGNLRKSRSSKSHRRANEGRLDPGRNMISGHRATSPQRSYRPCCRTPLLNMWFLLWLHPTPPPPTPPSPPPPTLNPHPSTTNLWTDIFGAAMPSLVFFFFSVACLRVEMELSDSDIKHELEGLTVPMTHSEATLNVAVATFYSFGSRSANKSASML